MIREATPTDAAAISQLICESVREHIAPTLSETGLQHLLSRMDEPSIVSYFGEGYPFFVEEIEGELIGVSAINPPTHLYYLFVRTEFQGTGTGRRLWTHVRDWILREHNAETITVNSSLNAIPIYEKFGFVLDGEVVERNEVCYQPMCWNTHQQI